MTIDFEDPGLEDRLTRRGDQLRRDLASPDLHSMIAIATGASRHRRRWAWPLVAAVLLLAIPLITVLVARRGHHPNSVPAGPDVASSQLLGSVTWNDAVLQPGGRSIAVLVDVDRTPRGYCLDEGLPVLKAIVDESPTSVHIEVMAYRPGPAPTQTGGTPMGCSDVGHAPVPVVVKLAGALAGRPVSGGTTSTVLDASAFPAPSYLPAGYVGSEVVVGGLGLVGLNLPHRMYLKADDGQLSVVGGAPNYEHPKTVETGTVHGQPAKVEQEGAFGDNVCLTWSEHGQVWSVCAVVGGGPALPAGELFKVADGLR